MDDVAGKAELQIFAATGLAEDNADINRGVELMQSYVLDDPSRERGSQRARLWPVEAPSLSVRYQHRRFDQRFQLSLYALIVGMAPFNGALVSAYFLRLRAQ